MNRGIWTLLAGVAGIMIIGAAVLLRAREGGPASPVEKITPPAPPVARQATFTVTQLAERDGKDGRDCYVVIKDKVYEIDQGRLWQNGEHSSSMGKASCGKDLTEVLGQSPHGSSKLEALEVVGTLAK